ncbi:hypothetical protein NL676_010891 [Syzygium grande]|nr:hypothetical protein NL676_010891 [Syzygium grande]
MWNRTLPMEPCARINFGFVGDDPVGFWWCDGRESWDDQIPTTIELESFVYGGGACREEEEDDDSIKKQTPVLW